MSPTAQALLDRPVTEREVRSVLHGDLAISLPTEEWFQIISAVEHRIGYFRGMARALADHREALGDPKPGVGEENLAYAVAKLERARRRIDAAFGWAGIEDPAAPVTESEARVLDGNR